MDWVWKEEWSSFYKDDGVSYVLLNKQLFGRWAIQFYKSLDNESIADRHDVSYDLNEAMAIGDKWLNIK